MTHQQGASCLGLLAVRLAGLAALVIAFAAVHSAYYDLEDNHCLEFQERPKYQVNARC